MTGRVVAPAPPAGPGMTPHDQAIDHYLSELARWRLHRDHELRALDQVVRTHEDRDGLNEDITLAMTLWHAIAQRHDLLLATWQDAQAGHSEREWVGHLIWGVLELPDGDARALAIALPEALRLSDALAGSLRARVHMEDEESVGDRIASLEHDSDRLRLHLEDRASGVADEDPSGAPSEGDGPAGENGEDTAAAADPTNVSDPMTAADQVAETKEVSDRLETIEDEVAELREDPTGEGALSRVGDLESRLARLERDLIVRAASQAHDRADPAHATAERQHLIARGEAVRSLAERVLNSVTPAPRLGIPDVTALGDVPEDEDELTAYMANLERVGLALDQAHATYAAALAEHAHLADRAESLAKTLAGCGAPTSVDLAGMLTAAKESLENRPADLQRASALIAAQEAYLRQLRPDA